MDQPVTQPAMPRPNWWKRNWKWFVPAGCFTVALLFVVFVASIVVIVFSAMKSTDVYKDALARAKANPAVIEALGLPIKDGFLLSGNTNVNGASGESNLGNSHLGSKSKRNNLRVGEKVTRPVELFGACRAGRTNARTHRSSPGPGACQVTLI